MYLFFEAFPLLKRPRSLEKMHI